MHVIDAQTLFIQQFLMLKLQYCCFWFKWILWCQVYLNLAQIPKHIEMVRLSWRSSGTDFEWLYTNLIISLAFFKRPHWIKLIEK